MAFKFLVYWTDLRGGYAEKISFSSDVINQNTDAKVGFVEATRSPRNRHISLFGGKYQGDFASQEECTAFAKGVEAVLNHATATDEEQIASEETA